MDAGKSGRGGRGHGGRKEGLRVFSRLEWVAFSYAIPLLRLAGSSGLVDAHRAFPRSTSAESHRRASHRGLVDLC
jgi:hypothetical protein